MFADRNEVWYMMIIGQKESEISATTSKILLRMEWITIEIGRHQIAQRNRNFFDFDYVIRPILRLSKVESIIV